LQLEAKQKNVDKNNLAQQEAAAINENQEETELQQSLADANETISSLRKSKTIMKQMIILKCLNPF
jgi:Skp family chaperone for outer membrane proteins